MIKLDLQRFAEGQDGAGSFGGGDVTGAGSQAAAVQPIGNQEQGMQQAGGAPSFDQLVQGQYRQEYETAVGQRIQQAIQARFRNQQDNAKELRAVQPIMQALGQRYGLDAQDVAGIAAKLNEDSYADEANRRGVTVDQVRNEHQVQSLREQLAARDREDQERQQFQQHFDGLRQQAEAFRQKVPGFDLMQEINTNPDFVRFTSPQVGMSVEQAFWACHGQDMQQQGMRYAAGQAAASIARSVAAGASRPPENGMNRGGPVGIAPNIAAMTPQQRADIRARIARGERVTF